MKVKVLEQAARLHSRNGYFLSQGAPDGDCEASNVLSYYRRKVIRWASIFTFTDIHANSRIRTLQRRRNKFGMNQADYVFAAVIMFDPLSM